MKKILHLLLLVPFVALMAGCTEDALTFSHEEPGFAVQSGKILIEALTRAELTEGDIYIAGPAIGDSISVVDNTAYQLVHSETVGVKYGVYLDPAAFKDGKTLADGFYFFSKADGHEMTAVGEEIVHTIDNAVAGGRYEVYLTSSWRSSFLVEPVIEHDGPVIFIDDQTGWDAITLYMWGDVNNLNGDWPGMQVTGTEKKAGVLWKYFDIGEENRGLSENLIFSNNGATQLADFNVKLDKNHYLIVTAEGVTEVEVDEGESLPKHDGYRVYADDQTGWDAITLYMWGDVNNLNGDWPGAQVAGTETIAGTAYKYFEYGDDLAGLAENLIFSNNGATQLADVNVKFAEDVKDYFFTVTASGATQIANPLGGDTPPAPEPEPEPEAGPKIYIDDQTEWPGNFYAHFWNDDGYSTEWPGIAATEEEIGGTTYKVIVTDASVKGQTLNVIFHSDENDSDNRLQATVNVDKDRYYVLTTSELTEFEFGVKIYIEDQTGWPADFYAHFWNDDGYSTEWPGIAATEEEIGGTTYKVIVTDANVKGQTLNVIFHSTENDSDNRLQATVKVDKDRYYILTTTALTEVDDPTVGVKVYIEDQTGWPADFYAHFWNDDGYSTEWPGIAATEEEIGGTTYKVVQTDLSVKGQTLNVIFHSTENDSDNRFQTTVKLDKARYYTLTPTALTEKE